MLLRKGPAIFNRDLVSEISTGIAPVAVAIGIADMLEEKGRLSPLRFDSRFLSISKARGTRG